MEEQDKKELGLEDDLLPAEIDDVTLNDSTITIVNDIIGSTDIDELKNLAKLFEINQAKKNALRIVKLNNLLDMVNDQAIERFTKRPYEVSTKELLDYMQVVNTQIEKSQKVVKMIDETPMIQINQQTNSINVSVGEEQLDRQSREKVIDAVKHLLLMVNKPKEEDVIDLTVGDVIDEEATIEENKTEGEE